MVCSYYGIKQEGIHTIVELLIVIVVIAVLATITVVAFQGTQARSRDSRRANDVTAIKKSLELYKIDNGTFPAASPQPGAASGWESSTDTAGTFLSALNGTGFQQTPLDPVNDITSGYMYLYYRYPAATAAATYGCNAQRGDLYVIRIKFENATGRPIGTSMGSECTSPQAGWSDTGTGNMYVYHAYSNG